MSNRWLLVLLCLMTMSRTYALEQSVCVAGIDPVRLQCDAPGPWSFRLAGTEVAPGLAEVEIVLESPQEERPPEFVVKFQVPGEGAEHIWSPYDDRYQLYAIGFDGDRRYDSQLAYRTPLISAFDDDNRNTMALACSEALRKMRFGIGINENTFRLHASFRFFTAYEPPMKSYRAKIRIDRRRGFWADAIREASEWVTKENGFEPCPVPEAAFDPLYSTWYAFWQDVDAATLEREMPLAASLGMKTAILDDGWQKQESASFYSATGDWMPTARRFPDLRGHVDAVHRAGLKYMLWLSVPYVGDETAAWKHFEGKYLRVKGENSPGRVGVLDPRFPEVREYLLKTYERVVRDWDFDGLKLDFIDQFVIQGEDPAERENFKGRDICSLPLAVDRLMKDVVRRVSAIKPNVLLEFRQQYMGPAILQYGNMIRVSDAPADPDKIRKCIADLRLTSGNAAVHADMIVWGRNETPERAARPILNCLFSAIQYSLRLEGLSAAHQAVIRHWIDFTQKHRETLLKGAFRPYHPELLFPRLEAESETERIVALYSVPQPVKVLANKKTIVVNATFAGELPVILEGAVEFMTCDVFGRETARRRLSPGVQLLQVPVSGYAEFSPVAR